MELLNSLFVPSTCLQGSRLPVHLIWDKDRETTVQINYPECFELDSIFNGIAQILDKNTLLFDKFEDNGYLGLVFKTSKISTPSEKEVITFSVKSKDRAETISKEVFLFRPEVKVLEIPDHIEVKEGLDGVPTPTKQIRISNIGEGTAVLGFNEHPDSTLRIKSSQGLGEFIINFWNDFSELLEDLKSTYPKYESLLERIIRLKEKINCILGETEVAELKAIVSELESVILSDSEFTDEYRSAVELAYLKNIRFITNIESFLIYLKSIDSNKLLLKNPIDVLNVKPEGGQFKANLNIIDLNYNSYPAVPVEFVISADEECEIPLYKLLDLKPTGV